MAGSMNMPLPGTMSFGNPTGIPGLNPKFVQETNNRLKQFVPGASKYGVTTLGNGGPNAFTPDIPIGYKPPTPISYNFPVTGQGGTTDIYRDYNPNNYSPNNYNNSNSYYTGIIPSELTREYLSPDSTRADYAQALKLAGVSASVIPGMVNKEFNHEAATTWERGNPGGLVPNNDQFNYGYYNRPNTASGFGIGSQLPGYNVGVSRDLQKQLDSTYGKGFGQTLGTLLSQGMGYNPQVVGAFMNDIQPYFQDNLNEIIASFAGTGGRFSSNAALAAGKFGADFTSHQQKLMAEMYMWAFQNYIGVLTKFGSQNTGSTKMGTLGDILSLTKTVASGLQGAGIGTNKDGTTSILGKILGGLSKI